MFGFRALFEFTGLAWNRQARDFLERDAHFLRP